MAIRLTGLGRTGLVAIAGTAVMVAGMPPAAADTDIRIVGGNATSAIVCGNVAVAQDLARQRGITLQKSKCTAKAAGGSATLQNVDITVAGPALARNSDNALLRALAGPPPGLAADRCENHRPGGGPGGVQLNKCFATGRGGRLKLQNVTLVNRQIDGRVTSRTVDDVTVSAGDNGGASAVCNNLVNHPLNQRDDCTASGLAATWNMRGVDVVIRNPDGSTSTRRGITVDVRGGNATAHIYCFNVTDGSGHVIQINVCNANSTGGDVTLRNVRINVVS